VRKAAWRRDRGDQQFLTPPDTRTLVRNFRVCETGEVLSEAQLKSRLAHILSFEEYADGTDWPAVSALCAELLQDLPEGIPSFVQEFLAQFPMRKIDPTFARRQRLIIVRYLRSVEFR